MSQAKTFGRYNLIRKVAQGGMAEIFLAKFQGIGGFEKKIIIKRILPRFSENQEFIKMLIHEAKTAVQLHHQNIVQIYDLGKVRDTYYISMEYIRGKDLRTVLNRLKSQGQLMPRELAVFVAREICKGLDYAHNITDSNGEPLNLVHRDISPPNVLLSLEGEVKIIDFGIAKATSQATDTQAGVFKGKFAYMAPEQASGVPVDRRADIFANGLILWEMLTCKKLLEAESDIATLERAKKIDNYAIPFGDYDIPEQLANIIRKSLKQDRPTRYQTAGEMARDLTIYLNLNYPGFSETDLADFLRTLFNLDKRRAGAGGDLVSHGQGERSLTGSDFFRALAQDGQEPQESAPKTPTGKAPVEPSRPSGEVTAQAVQAMAASPAPGKKVRRRPDGKPLGEGEYWSLENEIRDEIEVFAKGAEETAEGTGEETGDAGAAARTGWVSQLAQDFVSKEDGTLHPLISGALAASEDPSGPDDPTVLVKDGKVVKASALASNPPASVRQTSSGASQVAASPRNEPQATPRPAPPPPPPAAPALSAATRRSGGTGMWMAVAVAAVLCLMVVSALLFPDKLSSLRESLGLVRKTPVVVSVEPSDAVVMLNNEAVSGFKSGGTIELPLGQRHVLAFSKDGFEDKQVSIDLVAARSSEPVNVKLLQRLQEGKGKLAFENMLPGSYILLDDRPTTQDELLKLPTDKELAVKVTKENYVPFETRVKPSEELQTIKVKQEPAPVKLTIVGGPPKAVVIVDGKQVGSTPYEGDGYVPGKVYKIEVTAPGYQPYVTPWTPAVGTPFQLSPNMVAVGGSTSRPSTPTPVSTPRPAATPAPTPAAATSTLPESTSSKPRDVVQVTILATPWADVYIDGKLISRTPLRNHPLKVGKHQLRLVNPELDVNYEVTKDIQPTNETVVFNYELN